MYKQYKYQERVINLGNGQYQHYMVVDLGNGQHMTVDLGIWPIFAAIGSALWTAGAAVVNTAWAVGSFAVGSLWTVGSFIGKAAFVGFPQYAEVAGMGTVLVKGGVPSLLSMLGTVAKVAGTALSAVTASNTLISTFSRPEDNPASAAGQAVIQSGVSPQLIQTLEQQQTELERLHQEQLQKQEQLEKAEAEIESKQKVENVLYKYGPWIVAGAVVLGAVLVLGKRKK